MKIIILMPDLAGCFNLLTSTKVGSISFDRAKVSGCR